MSQEQKIAISKQLKYPQRFREWRQEISFSRRHIMHRVGRVNTVKYCLKTVHRHLDGIKLLFFSDLHCSLTFDRQLWHNLRDSINQAGADLIICGGDLPGRTFDKAAVSELLADCQASCKLAVIGNWERCEMSGMTTEQLRDFYRQHNFKLLCNQSTTWQGIDFYGLDDIKTGVPKFNIPDAPTAYRVLLAHNPDAIIHIADSEALQYFNLALCGHTHAGQVRMPLLGPLASASRYGRRFDGGQFAHRRYKQIKLCISAGIGTSAFPWRLNCPPEIMLIEFTGKV